MMEHYFDFRPSDMKKIRDYNFFFIDRLKLNLGLSSLKTTFLIEKNAFIYFRYQRKILPFVLLD